MRSSIALGDEDTVLRTTVRIVRWRLLLILFLMYVVAWIDRVNVGFAALQMKVDLLAVRGVP
ncbi:MAG: hypothetical protein M3Y30_04315 [Gemmatimonadota bacterium]|nr:hypothetical protein [Gemmatimonadota bacterium]